MQIKNKLVILACLTTKYQNDYIWWNNLIALDIVILVAICIRVVDSIDAISLIYAGTKYTFCNEFKGNKVMIKYVYISTLAYLKER